MKRIALRVAVEREDYNCRVRIGMLTPGVIAAILVGCAPGPEIASGSPSPAFVTATLAGDVAQTGTEPAVTIAVATAMPMAGTTTTQVNVRQEPLASGRVLGTLAASAMVQIHGRDAASNWYLIAYEAGNDGMGWVSAQYVSVADPAAVPTARAGPLGSVRDQINVRSGPGTQFDAVGLLSPRDVVTLTGKDAGGAWLEITFPAGPNGKAWVAASFLETGATDRLPIVTESGDVVGTGTPSAQAPSPTPAPATAADDQDSATAPGLDLRFSPGGVGSVFYSDELSAPRGDNSDWLLFTPYYDSVRIGLECEGNGTLASQILSEGATVAGVPNIMCGASQVFTLQSGQPYLLHLWLEPEPSAQTHVRYDVRIFAVPAY